MFLRSSTRKKNGKLHTYWSVVENRRVGRARVVQRHVLYLGEINTLQQEAWQESIEVFTDGGPRPKTAALWREPAADEVTAVDAQRGTFETVCIRAAAMTLHRPRQWGACWLFCHLYQALRLDEFFAPLLPASRKGTRWDLILKTLCCYRLLSPGSEWRLHRQWFERSAMGDLLGGDFDLVQKDNLYRCRDKEQAMRRRRLKTLVKRLHELRQQKLTRDQLLIKLGAARKEAGPAAWRIIDLRLPDKDEAVTPETFGFHLNWQNLREARRREGSYLAAIRHSSGRSTCN